MKRKINLKILVVFTGGTIGSTEENGCVSTDSKKPYRLLSLYQEKMNENVENIQWEVQSPYEILSENMSCYQLGLLTEYLRQKAKENYDGIIVTHGTDTLQYTAATLTYCLSECTVPIVLVSSNYVLEDKRANGLDNFTYAVEFIKTNPEVGVYVSYRNQGDVPRIHKGSRLMAHPAYSDDISSLSGQEYGWFQEENFQKNPQYQKFSGMHQEWKIPLEERDSGVLQIFPYPGMKYPELDNHVKAVLHHTYHSGTICSMNPSLKVFMEAAKQRGIPVFVAGTGDSAEYESKKIYEQLGMHPLPVASPIAMYIKLWLCLVNQKDPMEIMYQSFGDDILKMN